jgi:hypothetical protein
MELNASVFTLGCYQCWQISPEGTITRFACSCFAPPATVEMRVNILTTKYIIPHFDQKRWSGAEPLAWRNLPALITILMFHSSRASRISLTLSLDKKAPLSIAVRNG